MKQEAKKSESEFRVLIAYPNLPMMLVPPLSVGIFTQVLKSHDYRVDLFDTTHYSEEEDSFSQNLINCLQVRDFNEEDLGIIAKNNMLSDFRKKTLDFKPDLILFSIVEDVYYKSLGMLDCIKDLNIPSLLGGVFPTVAPDECFKSALVNFVGLGEGETTIVAVAEALRKNQPLHNIPGTWYRDDDGVIHKNPQSPLVDLNKQTADYSLFAESRFIRTMGGEVFKTIPIETYRGCPFACTYCNSPGQVTFSREQGLGSFLRRKTMDCLANELRELIKLYDPEFIFIIDDSFLARPDKEVFDFCDMYEEFKLPFYCNSRPETCDAEKLRRLKEVGCFRISYAIEAGNESYRTKVLKRKGSNEEMIRWSKIITESQIPYSINLIVGFPGETREMVMETIELVRRIPGYDTLTVSIFTPYHGTALRDVGLKNGWINPGILTSHLLADSLLNMPPPYLSAEEISGLVRTFPLYCYFPKSEWPNIQRAEKNDEYGNQLLNEYSEIYKKEFLGETQDRKLPLLVEGPGGCRSNPKDSYPMPQRKFSSSEIERLVIPSKSGQRT